MGGSGILATELGKALADRGHDVHLISADLPFRLSGFHPGLSFHQVHTPGYPLFHEPQYLLSLANTIVQVAREHRLDIVHAHYAVPHATAAVLARQVLAAAAKAPAPRVVTTLHGTDITVVGADPSVLGDRRVLDRPVRRRHCRLEQPARRDLPRARRPSRDRRHSQLPRLPGLSARRGAGAAAALRRAGPGHADRDAPLEFPSGQADRFGRGGVRADRRARAGQAPPGRRRAGARHRPAAGASTRRRRAACSISGLGST